MTTSELKSYIDRILGNNIRLLLPSYWWKRAFGAVIDKVDEKVEKSDFKTINGESVLGEGDLRVGVKSVESVEALEALNAKVGDIASVGVESLEVVSVGNLHTSTFDDFSKDWDNLTRINKIELGEPVTDDGAWATVALCKRGSSPHDDMIRITLESGRLYVTHHYADSDTSSVTTYISESKANDLLKKDDYRLYNYNAVNTSNTLNAVEAVDKIVKLIIDHSSADAYIKGKSWKKLADEDVIKTLAQGVNEEMSTLGGLLNQLNATTAQKAEYTYVDNKVATKADKEYVDNAFAKEHTLIEFNIEDDMNLTVTYIGMEDGSFQIDENGYLTLK